MSNGEERGRVSFTPEPGLGRARRLVAVVSRNGVPVREIVVARYRVADRAAPARPRRVRVKRRGVTWAPAAGAKRYLVSIEPPRRAARTQTVRKRRVKLAAKTPVGTIVRVAGVDSVGHVGPAASARVGH